MTFTQLTNDASHGAPRLAPARTRRFTDHDPAAPHEAVDLVATARVAGAELCDRICRVRSLSLGGAFVELDPLPMGTVVHLTFSVPRFEERLSLDAVVHWSSEDGVSVLFDSLRATDVWILWQFLARSSREAGGSGPTVREHTVIVALDR
ncbi:MAG TPA: PilZ domain-containing protein [Kofleriaceae bacterium]